MLGRIKSINCLGEKESWGHLSGAEEGQLGPWGGRAKEPGRMLLFLLIWRLGNGDLEERSYVSVDFLGSKGRCWDRHGHV